jgi:hypothetical protein
VRRLETELFDIFIESLAAFFLCDIIFNIGKHYQSEERERERPPLKHNVDAFIVRACNHRPGPTDGHILRTLARSPGSERHSDVKDQKMFPVLSYNSSSIIDVNKHSFDFSVVAGSLLCVYYFSLFHLHLLLPSVVRRLFFNLQHHSSAKYGL